MNKWEKDKENGGLSGGKDYYNPCLREGLSGRITKIIYNLGEDYARRIKTKIVFFLFIH